MRRDLICFTFLVVSLLLIIETVMAKDYYEILGVARDASTRQIKKAFRSLSMKYHPDKNRGNKEAEEKYLEINKGNNSFFFNNTLLNSHTRMNASLSKKVYEVLADEEKRRIYDQFGEEGLQRNQGGGGAGNPFADIFGFNFGFNQQGQNNGF